MRTERTPWAPPAPRPGRAGASDWRDPARAGQRVAGKILGLLLSEMSALTRPLSAARSGLPSWGPGQLEMGGIGRRNARGRAPQAQPPPRPPTSSPKPWRPPRNDAGMPARARRLAVTAEPRRATISYPAWPGYPARRRRAYLRRHPPACDPRRFYIRAGIFANAVYKTEPAAVRSTVRTF